MAAAGSTISSLFGPELVTASGATVKTDDRLAGKDTVAVYFSAHWCPPCKMFTPMLSKWFTANGKAKNTEIVFASSDKSEGEFKSYLGEMSWGLALPFRGEAKERLASMCKVRGIPTLAIFDAKTGELITTKGREGVSSDPSAWPFRPKPMSEVVGEAKLTSASGTSTTGAELIASGDLDYLVFYFSASWCGPCQGFTPRLAAWYAAHHSSAAAGKKFEVVLVSGDRTPDAAAAYHSKMPWHMVDFSDKAAAAALNTHFEVEGIPTLTVLDAKTFKTVTNDARGLVLEAPEDFPWLPTPVARVSQALGSINDKKTVLLFTDKATSPTAKVEAEFEKAATKYFGGDVEIQFAVVTAEHDFTDRLRGFLGLSGDADGPDACRLIMLDIPSGVKYDLGTSLSTLAEDGAVTEAVDSVFTGKASPSALG